MTTLIKEQQASFELLGSGSLTALPQAVEGIKHGDLSHLILAPQAPVDTARLMAMIDDAAVAVGCNAPEKGGGMAFLDPQGRIHLRLLEQSPGMGLMVPILLAGLTAVPLLFFLFREENPFQVSGNGTQNTWMKYLPFLVLGGLVIGAIVLTALVAKPR